MSLAVLSERATEPRAPVVTAPHRDPLRVGRGLVVTAIMAAGLAARLYQIGKQSMWLDEAVSSWYSDHGLVALWSWSHPLDPYHPPGYYSLLTIWQLGGHGEAWLRSFSALAGVAAIPFLYAATRRIAGSWAAWIAAALLALSPLQVRFGQETRTYALLVLEAAVIFWAIAFLLRYPRIAAAPLRGNPAALRWYAYIGAMGLALLSHNTAPLIWLTVNLTVLLHWRLTPHRSTAFLWSWFRANLAIAAIWLVWIPVFIRQSMATLSGTGHRKVPSAGELVMAFRDLSLGQSSNALDPHWIVLGDVLAAATLAGALVIARRRRPRVRRWALTLLVFTVTAPTTAYVASVLGKPVFLTQSLMWVSVPFFALVGLLVTQLPRVLVPLVAAMALVVTSIGLVNYYPTAYKEPWRDAAAYLQPRLEPGDLVVYSADYVAIPMQYYLRAPDGVTQIGTKYLPDDISTVRLELPDAADVWLVYAHWEFADPNQWVDKVLHERGDVVERKNWGEDIQLVRFRARPAGDTGGH